MKQHNYPLKTYIKAFFLFFGCIFLSNTSIAQLTLNVTVNDGEVTTTCTDNLSSPDPRFRVSVAGGGFTTYPATGFCFEELPHLKYTNTVICGNDLPTMVQVCLRAFEDDGSFCNISPDCQEEICEDFVVPAPNTSVNYTLTTPNGLSSWGEVDFTFEVTGTYYGAPNDNICDAINMGVLPFGGSLGDASVSSYVNYCANNWMEPNPQNDGAWQNDQGVWFTFTTSNDPTSTIVEFTSDPSNFGDPLSLQWAIYESSDGTCNGTLTYVDHSFTAPDDFDEIKAVECLDPNTTYFIIVDGTSVINGGIEGVFGFELTDEGAVSGGDEMCDAQVLGAVPEGGFISVLNQSNICSDYTFIEPWTSAFVPQQTVWYQFTVPSSGHIIIEGTSHPENPIGIQFALFTSSTSTCTGWFQQIGTNYTWQDLDEVLEMQCLEEGLEVWLLVDGDGNSTSGIFDLMIIDGGDVAPQSTTQIDETLCAGQSIVIGGTVIDETTNVNITVDAWNGCDSLITGLVTVLPPLSSDIDTTICFGESVTIGSTDYDMAGQYAPVLVTPDGCDSVVNLTLNITDAMIALADQTVEATAYQAADGEAMVSGVGGAGGYTYLWSDGQTTATAVNLIGGENYCVTITDAIGCTAEDCVLVLFPSNIITNLDNFLLDCPGDTDGQLDLSVSNGAAPYDYTWENTADPAINGSGTIVNEGGTNTILNLAAGTYSFTISDAFGLTIAIGEVLDPMALITTIDTTLCAGESITVGSTVINSTGPINELLTSYLGCDSTVTGMVTVLDPIATSLDETLCFGESLTVGTVVYDVTGPINEVLTSFAGCDSIITGNLLILPGISTTIDTTICFGESITIGGVSYNSTGTWTETETSYTTCDSTITANLVVLDELIVDAIVTASASGPAMPDGEATANVMGGQATYTYLWSDGSTTQTATNLIGGQNYCVTVTDNIGCTATDCVTIDFPSNIEVTMLDDNLDCNGDTDGSLTVDINFGQAPYGYIWQNQDNSLNGFGSVLGQNGDAVIAGLPPGTYYVTVSDIWGQAEAVASVIEPDLLTATVVENATSCFGECNGSSSFTISGGTAPYQYNWPTGDTGPTANDLCAGVYLVTVTDANNCEAVMSTSIAEPDEVIATAVEVNPVSCFAGNDGQATVTITGTAQSYLWDNGETTATAGNLDAGVHSVVVIDINGCESMATVTITEPDEPVLVDVTIDETIACFGGDEGVLLANATGGSGGFTYEWSNGTVNNLANGLTVGTYTVTATDITGCTAIAAATLDEPNEIFAQLSSVAVTCPLGINSGSITVDTAFGGMNDGFTYSLNGINYVNDSLFQDLVAGTYEVYVQDLAGCVSTFDIEVEAPDDILLDLGEDQQIDLGETVDVEAIVFNPNLVYNWTSSDNIPIACLDCDEITVTPVGNTVYQLMVTDTITGCTAIDEMTVNVILERNVYIPNAFSPNGDGFNDYFFINAGPEVQSINNFRIFNRWGAQVFEATDTNPNDYSVGWNGSFKGETVSSGVYIFMVEIEFIDGEVLIYEGDISVIK